MSYPTDAPKHPWDEGKWIFPDDHPFSRYERDAYRGQYNENELVQHEAEEAKEAFLEAGKKMLPPGK